MYGGVLLAELVQIKYVWLALVDHKLHSGLINDQILGNWRSILVLRQHNRWSVDVVETNSAESIGSTVRKFCKEGVRQLVQGHHRIGKTERANYRPGVELSSMGRCYHMQQIQSGRSLTAWQSQAGAELEVEYDRRLAPLSPGKAEGAV